MDDDEIKSYDSSNASDPDAFFDEDDAPTVDGNSPKIGTVSHLLDLYLGSGVQYMSLFQVEGSRGGTVGPGLMKSSFEGRRGREEEESSLFDLLGFSSCGCS